MVAFFVAICFNLHPLFINKFNMKKIVCGLLVLLMGIISFAQSAYDAKEAFNPQFYPYPGNDYRSASGEPGPKYWQNRADYKINCTLDTLQHSVIGDAELTYTNNSPIILNSYGCS